MAHRKHRGRAAKRKRRLWVAAAITNFILVLTMAEKVLNLVHQVANL